MAFLQGALIVASQGAVIDLSQPVSSSITPNGIYWNFDGTANDGSGNGYNGSLMQGAGGQPMPTYVPGKFGSAIRLQGNSDSVRDPYVYFDGAAASDNTKLDFVDTSFTGGAWLSFSSINTGINQKVMIFERGVSVYSGSGNFFSFQLQKVASNVWTIRLLLGNGSTLSTLTSTASTTAFNTLDSWNHVGFTFETGAEGNTVRFYINGVQLGDDLKTTLNLAATSTTTQRQFSAGERNVANYESNFNGSIDDLFLTSGVHVFSIPEPRNMVLLISAGGVLCLLSTRRAKALG